MTEPTSPARDQNPADAAGGIPSQRGTLPRLAAALGSARWATGLLVAGSAIVLLLALRVRLPNLGGRPLGFDESFHSLAALGSSDFDSLRRAAAVQFQPILDHVLRRYLWAPLLGHEELGIRLPALLASLLGIVATILAAAWGFLANGRSRVMAVIAALAIGVWHAGFGQDIGASGFARHYALTGCLSVAWVALFLFGDAKRSWKRLALLSLVFANTHFFALALIGTGYAYRVGEHLLGSRRRAALREAVVLVATIGLTAAINAASLAALLGSPVAPRALGEGGVLASLTAAGDLLARFLGFLDLPLVPAALWAALVLLGALRGCLPRPLVARAASLIVIAVPGLFLLASLRSTVQFEERYFMPLLGMAPLLLILGALVLVELVERAVARFWPTAAGLGLAVLPLLAYLAGGGARLASMPGALAAPALPTQRAARIEAIKAESRPVFLLASPCWTEAVLRLYWRSIGTPAPALNLQGPSHEGYDACVVGGFAPGSSAERQLADFLRRHPDGMVALYQHHLPCFRPRFAPPARLANDGTSTSCLTIMRDVRSVEDARASAVAVGYPATLTQLLQERLLQYENLRF